MIRLLRSRPLVAIRDKVSLQQEHLKVAVVHHVESPQGRWLKVGLHLCMPLRLCTEGVIKCLCVCVCVVLLKLCTSFLILDSALSTTAQHGSSAQLP